jgi:uncharacterized protein with beta-barrel porin domain
VRRESVSNLEAQEGKVSEDTAYDEPRKKVLKERVILQISENVYSRYAATENERSVGQVLDHVRRLPEEAVTPALKTLYAALDSSSSNGSEIRSALGQLSPVAYGGSFSVSRDREHLISDTLRARPSMPIDSRGRWYGFVLPFASQGQEKSVGSQVRYSARTSGIVFGIEQDVASVRGLTWGFHGVVTSKGSLSFKTDGNAAGTLQAWDFGVQMRYQPDVRAGFDVSAHARLGLEQGHMSRSLGFGSYSAEQKGKWQGRTSSSAVFGTYLWSLSPTFSIGPVIGLEYVTVYHPRITERSSRGLDLVLDPMSFNSLRSSLGLRGVVFVSDKLKMHLQARWDRELLNRSVKQRGSFASYSDRGFYTETVSASPDDVQVSGELSYDISQQVSVGARAAVQFSRFARPELLGNVALKVRF